MSRAPLARLALAGTLVATAGCRPRTPPAHPLSEVPAPETPDPGWRWVRPLPQGNTLDAVWGSTPDDVYAVGDHGTILHSTDRGATWTPQASGTAADLTSVWGSGPDDVFVGGDDLVLHSTDHGVTWRADSIDGRVAIAGAGPGEVLAVGATAVHRTTDHGATWSLVADASHVEPQRYDGNDAAEPATFDRLAGVSPDGRTVYAAFTGGTDHAAGGKAFTERPLFATTDGGKTWRQVATPGQLASCEETPARHVRLAHAGGLVWVLGTAAAYTDLATQATPAEAGGDGTPGALASFVPLAVTEADGQIVGAGDRGTVATWTESPKGGWHWVAPWTGTTSQLRGLWSSGSDTFAVGAGGTILRSQQRHSWERTAGAEADALYGIWSAPGLAVAVGDAQTLLVSTDEGATWQRVAVPGATPQPADPAEQFALYAVWASGPDDIYVVGGAEYRCAGYEADTAVALRSTDRGRTWSALVTPPAGALYTVWGTGPDDVYAGGFHSILHSADHGHTWSEYRCADSEAPTGPGCAARLYGAGPGDAWALRPAGATPPFLHSSDRGRTWTPAAASPIPPPGPTIRVTTTGPIEVQPGAFRVAGASADLYRFGEANSILRSVDGGKTWTIEWPGSGNALNALIDTGQDVWAVGANGTILRHHHHRVFEFLDSR